MTTKILRIASSFSCFLLALCAYCQFQASGSWGYLLPPTTAINIGTAATGGSLLTVSGDQLASGEVFRTYSNNTDTYWRMYKAGAVQVGNIWAPNLGSENWYINAVPGDLRFQTNTTDRGMFNRVLPGQTIGVYGGLDFTGFFGVGPFSSATYTNAVAKIHIDRSGTNTLGYRPLMTEGVLATAGSGLLYSGLFNTSGSDLGFAWSHSSAYTPLRFTFTSIGGATGVEQGRFEPASAPNTGYFGLGDWAGLAVAPNERLDLADHTIRLRNFMDPLPAYLSTSYEDGNLDRVLVVNPADGRVYWRQIAGLTCDWEVLNANNDVVTAYTGNACPPQDDANVGIGTSTPSAKLQVERSISTAAAFEVGTLIRLSTATTNNAGLFSSASGPAASYNWGVLGNAENGGRDYGVSGSAENYGFNVGVYGFAERWTCPDWAVGVWGRVDNFDPTCANVFAGYFEGDILTTGTSYAVFHQNTSDAMLKTNVQPLSGALGIIAQLQPRTYLFLNGAFPQLILPTDTQPGFVAQEVEALLPQLVTETVIAARFDSLGNVITPELTLKTLNYDGLIPYSIAGIQELAAQFGAQQQQIAVQSAEIAAMQQQLASCCAVNDDGTRMHQGTGIGYIDQTRAPAAQATAPLSTDDLVVIPNPFQNNPTISYRIGTTGRAQLRVSDSHGRTMGILFDAGLQAGQHTMVWNTTGMAAGTYWLTLTLDGQRITEQAVKVE